MIQASSYFTDLRTVKDAHLTASSTSLATPLSVPVARYQATFTDAAACPAREAIMKHLKAAVCRDETGS